MQQGPHTVLRAHSSRVIKSHSFLGVSSDQELLLRSGESKEAAQLVRGKRVGDPNPRKHLQTQAEIPRFARVDELGREVGEKPRTEAGLNSLQLLLYSCQEDQPVRSGNDLDSGEDANRN